MAFLFISTTVPNIISTLFTPLRTMALARPLGIWRRRFSKSAGIPTFKGLKYFYNWGSNDAIFYQRLINDWTFLHWAGALFAPALSKLINSGWSEESGLTKVTAFSSSSPTTSDTIVTSVNQRTPTRHRWFPSYQKRTCVYCDWLLIESDFKGMVPQFFLSIKYHILDSHGIACFGQKGL